MLPFMTERHSLCYVFQNVRTLVKWVFSQPTQQLIKDTITISYIWKVLSTLKSALYTQK